MFNKSNSKLEYEFKKTGVYSSNVKTDREYEVHPSSAKDPKFRALNRNLLSWLNQQLRQESLSLGNIEDLKDGIILGRLLSKWSGETVPVIAAVSDRAIEQNLNTILEFMEARLAIKVNYTVKGIMSNDIVSMLRLLIDLAHAFDGVVILPSDVSVAIQHNEKDSGGVKVSRTQLYQLTGDESGQAAYGSQQELSELQKDAMDRLAESDDPNAWEVVQKSLLKFAATHLSTLGVEIVDLGQFHDGVLFIALVGIICQYFVPLNQYLLNPTNLDGKLTNLQLVFHLLEGHGLTTSRWNTVEVAGGDKKMICRILFDIFQAFRNTEN